MVEFAVKFYFQLLTFCDIEKQSNEIKSASFHYSQRFKGVIPFQMLFYLNTYKDIYKYILFPVTQLITILKCIVSYVPPLLEAFSSCLFRVDICAFLCNIV